MRKRNRAAARTIPPSNELGLIEFSSANFPESQRLASCRRVLGRSPVRLDIEPLTNAPFSADLRLFALPQLSVAWARFSPARLQRPPQLAADHRDDFVLLMNLSGPLIASHRKREITLGDGDALLVSCAEPGIYIRPSIGEMIGVCIPRSTLLRLMPDVDDETARLIRRDGEALKLLTRYVGSLATADELTMPELRQLLGVHICELMVCAIGAKPSVRAGDRSPGATHLRAIKAAITKSLARHDLGVESVARSHGMTARHLQRLFKVEGVTFSNFLLAQRLARAHGMLTDLRFAERTISAIASDSGFADRSHFNRAFRLRYGASPSEVRMSTQDAASKSG